MIINTCLKLTFCCVFKQVINLNESRNTDIILQPVKIILVTKLLAIYFL